MRRLLGAADAFGRFMDDPIADRCLVGMCLLGAVLIAIAAKVPA